MKPLVGIFAHPDDESFGPGGSLAKYAGERDVYLICVTNGNAGLKGVKKEGELCTIREEELSQAAKILGIKNIDFLGFEDGELCNSQYHTVAQTIIKKLEEIKPDTLMTFEPLGWTGHLDHIAVSLITTYAFQRLEFIKTLLYYCETTTIMQEMQKSVEYFIYTPPGYEEDQIDLVIDVADFWQQRIDAMSAHTSQKKDAKWITQLLEKFPKKEHFLVLNK